MRVHWRSARYADQEGGTGPGEGGASIEEGCGLQDLQLLVPYAHDLLLEGDLPRIQFDHLDREGKPGLVTQVRYTYLK